MKLLFYDILNVWVGSVGTDVAISCDIVNNTTFQPPTHVVETSNPPPNRGQFYGEMEKNYCAFFIWRLLKARSIKRERIISNN